MNKQILVELQRNRNIKAFMRVVRERESSQAESAYTVINGGSHFTDFSRHPKKIVPPGISTAAGAYQFIFSTWEEEALRWEFSTFEPFFQDLGCISRFIFRQAIQAITTGRFELAVSLCRKEWTSLPGAAEVQTGWTMEKAKAVFIRYSGLLSS